MLQALPASCEPLDVVAIDGFLCGVLLQPTPVPLTRWMPFVVDAEGRPAPPDVDLAPLRELLERRHRELNRAIAQRQWFDPWVFDLEADDERHDGDDGDDPDDLLDAVRPWAIGFATALEAFPGLLDAHEDELIDALALLYQSLDADDFDDAQALVEALEAIEPPPTLDDAVEDLVQGVLLAADVSRPQR